LLPCTLEKHPLAFNAGSKPSDEPVKGIRIFFRKKFKRDRRNDLRFARLKRVHASLQRRVDELKESNGRNHKMTTEYKSTGTARTIFVRFLAGALMVALYCFNTVVLTGFALTSSTTSVQARGRGGRGGGGRGGRGGGGFRGRGRGRGAWWAGACHLPGTSLWYGSCW
jgi:hypothetical protein